MSDRDALLAAVRADPDNDLPRLVYADWLEEHDEERQAAFIRAEVALARLEPNDDDIEATAEQASVLWRDDGRAWRIPGLSGLQVPRRGLIEVVETSAEALIAVPPEVLLRYPIRRLRLVTADEYIDELLRLPIWSTVESLILNNNLMGTRERISRLFNEADFGKLHELSMQNNRLWPEAMEMLLNSPVMPNLAHLNLSGNPIGTAGLEQLAASPHAAGLRELILRSDELPYSECIHAAGAAALAASTSLSHLRTLNLAGHSVGDAGAIDIARSLTAGRLLDLDLSFNDLGSLGDTAYEDLTNPLYLPNLRKLNLAGNTLNGLAAEAILREWAVGLSSIDLRECRFEGYALERLIPAARAGRILLDEEHLSSGSQT